ncbi:MAG: hypothetical protein Q8Q23_03695 [bacterium]|nr:hypothetical protein [bacterium]
MKFNIQKLNLQQKKIILMLGILIIFFSTLLFLYNNFYLTMQRVSEIHELKSNNVFPSINQEIFDQAYNLIELKKSYELRDISNLKSPFIERNEAGVKENTEAKATDNPTEAKTAGTEN